MEFKRKTPGKGRMKQPTWAVLSVEAGEGFNLWKAGPAVWLTCHWVNNRSLPCYWEITDGKIECPNCGVRTYGQGYVPCYDEAGKPVIVVVKLYSEEIVNAIKLHHPMYAHRKKGRGQPITLTPKTTGSVYRATNPERMQPAKIEEALLCLWKDDTLKAFFANQQPAEEKKPLVALMDEVNESRAATAKKNEEFARAIKESLPVRNDTLCSLPELNEVLTPIINGAAKKKKS